MTENPDKKYMLTEGGILRKLLVVAIPIMGTQLVQMSYNLTDMFWLGKVGEKAVAASGTAGMFMWLSMAFVMIGRMGAEIGVAQSLGRGTKENALGYAQTSIVLAMILGTLFGLVLIVFRGPLVGFFNMQDATVARDTRNYLFIVSLAMPATFVTSAIVGIFNGTGNTRMPFIVNAIGLVTNMILDPLMIFTFGLGITGAAIATICAQFLAFLLMVLAVKKSKSRPFEKIRFFKRPDGTFTSQILKWTIPISLQSLFFTVMSMIANRFVNAFGTSAVAVGRVGSQIESLSWLIGGGFGSAVTAFMGQNYGAGKWTRIRKGFRISCIAMAVYGTLITCLIYFGAAFLFSIFLSDPDIVSMGVVYLHILAICQIPQCLEAVAESAFKGTGRTMPPSVVSISSNILRVILAFALSKTALGLSGIWIAITLTASMRGLVTFIWYLLASQKHPTTDLDAAAEVMAHQTPVNTL